MRGSLATASTNRWATRVIIGARHGGEDSACRDRRWSGVRDEPGDACVGKPAAVRHAVGGPVRGRIAIGEFSGSPVLVPRVIRCLLSMPYAALLVAAALLPLAAHEYVAYVVMFATMEPGLRERVLARYPGTGFESTLQINAAVYLVDPLQFAAESWRHYLKRQDRAAWLRDLVGGYIVQQTPADAP